MEILRKHKSSILLTLILIVASFLRLYRVSDYMTFLGDEGRDVLVSLHMLQGDIPFLGPRASAGDFFLGPIYYYFMTPFLWLFNYDPVGPAIMVSLFGIATVYLVYYITKEFFGLTAGLVAAALYSVSPLVLRFSRSSWNPNLMPFFSLLIVYVMYHAVKNPTWKRLGLVGVLYGIAMQLHYIEVFLGVTLFFFFLIGTWIVNKESYIINILRNGTIVVTGFLVSMLPFLAFEVKNGFPNIRTIFSFIFTSSTSDTYEGGGTFMGTVVEVFIRLFGNLLARYSSFIGADSTNQFGDLYAFAIIIVAISSIILLFKNQNKLAVLLLSLWLFFGVVLFGFYKKEIYDYYFAFMFPLPFILVGNLLAHPFTVQKKAVLKVISIFLFLYLLIYNLYGLPFRQEPNRMKNQAKLIADFVMKQTENKPYNFALLADSNSDHAYRYFFEIEKHIPITIENSENDPKRKTVTDQLFVVCENPPCEPLGHPIFEIAGFGPATIVNEWDVSVVKVYKLVHAEDTPEE